MKHVLPTMLRRLQRAVAAFTDPALPARYATVVLIDADNVSPRILDPLIELLRPDHRVSAVRVYRNFGSGQYKGWNTAVMHHGALGTHTPTLPIGKNAADMQLTVDAMDLLHTTPVRSFVLVSNDGDFTPLAIRLASAGCEVLGFGTGQASPAFRAACTEFRTIEMLLEAARSL